MRKRKSDKKHILSFLLSAAIFGGYSFYMKLVKGQSAQSKLIEYLLRIGGGKWHFTSAEKADAYVEERRIENGKPYKIPIEINFFTERLHETVREMDVYTLKSRAGTPIKQILYLHGGAYVHQPIIPHWTFLDKLAHRSKAVVTVPIYPLTPNHQFMEAYDKILPVYENLLQKATPDNIIIMGDSAGGGLALGLGQLLLEKGLPQPSNIILLSPWLDITMKNPNIQALEDKDPTLSPYGLALLGRLWAGEHDPDYYLLSPINGKINGLGRITLFVGTNELFFSDAEKFNARAEAEGVPINYFVYKNMNHVFPLYPIPEAKRAFKQILEIINGVNSQ